MRRTASAVARLAVLARLLTPAALPAAEGAPGGTPVDPDPAETVIRGDHAELVLTALQRATDPLPADPATVIPLRLGEASAGQLSWHGKRLAVLATVQRNDDGSFDLRLDARGQGAAISVRTGISAGHPVVMRSTRGLIAPGVDLGVLVRPERAEAARHARGITLGIGDAAPPLTVATWVVGAPVTSLADGRMTIVEFGRSWQCLYRDAQPRLSAIHRRFAGEGVRTVAVKIPPAGHPERPPQPPPELLALADHHLAIDDTRSLAGGAPATATAWLRAAGRWLPREEDFRTPTAMIVDGGGRIRWIGDPRRGLERIVGGMLDGTWVGLSVVSVDSEQIDADEKAENAVDGDPLTIWHTQWRGGHPACPHEIVIALSQEAVLTGITYLPRQNSLTYGTIADYAVYLSDDGVGFGDPVASGSFAPDKALKLVGFAPRKARFVKLRSLAELTGMPWTSAAEIGIVRPGDPAPVMPAVLPLETDDPPPDGASDF